MADSISKCFLTLLPFVFHSFWCCAFWCNISIQFRN